jgi:hypothetical protein
MATKAQFEHEDIAAVPRGWKVRTSTQEGGTQVRVAYPPGRRRKGSGKLISILHPKNPAETAEATVRYIESPPDPLTKKPGTITEVLFSDGKVVRFLASIPSSQAITRARDVLAKKRINPKTKTAEQVEKMQAKAVKFLRDVVGDDEKAREIEGMSLQEYADKKKVQIENPKKRQIANPDETAEATRLYEEFHGKRPSQVQDLHEREVARDTYTALGDLLELRFNRNGEKYKLDFKDCRVKLASSAKGTQLYLIGGDQNCDALRKNGDKDFVYLGVIDAVTYVTRKGFDKFHEAAYQHKFGEEGGEKPWGLYNRLSKRIFMVDGSYRIEAPGIID